MRKLNKILFLILFVTVVSLCGCKKKINNNETKNDNVLIIRGESRVPSSGTVHDYEPLKNIEFASWVFKNRTNFYTITTGAVKAKVLMINYNQSVNALRILKDNYLFKKSISRSTLKSVADERLIYNNMAYIRPNGKVISDDEASFDDNCDVITKEEYLSTYGISLDEMSGYIISKDTVQTIELLESENNNYKVLIKLDPDKASIDYKKEMKMMASSSDYPSFINISLTITMDDKWNVLEIETVEEYDISISLLGHIRCIGKLKEEFKYDDKEIDDLSFFSKYINQ